MPSPRRFPPPSALIAPPGSSFEINIGQLLPVVVTHDEASFEFFNRSSAALLYSEISIARRP
jgi:hypothetical protein